ncbi:MAG TPA: hypothetical protein VGK87_17730 [Anaerolineae bacterium]
MSRRLFAAVLVMLVIVGTVIIALAYGFGPAAMALVCLITGGGLLGILWLIYSLIGRWAGVD